MVGVAQHLVGQPPLHDPARRATVLAELRARKLAGAAILAVFHDVPDTPGLVDRVLTMRDGELAA